MIRAKAPRGNRNCKRGMEIETVTGKTGTEEPVVGTTMWRTRDRNWETVLRNQTTNGDEAKTRSHGQKQKIQRSVGIGKRQVLLPGRGK